MIDVLIISIKTLDLIILIECSKKWNNNLEILTSSYRIKLEMKIINIITAVWIWEELMEILMQKDKYKQMIINKENK